MKKIILLPILICLLTLANVSIINAKEQKTQLRKVAVQGWTFHKFTFEEMLEKVKDLNLYGVECMPQLLSDKYPNVKIDPNMNEEQKAYLKKLLKDYNLKMTGYGVTYFNDNTIEKLCKFVKEFDCNLILTESDQKFFPKADEIAGKYGVKIAIHHHTPGKNNYWNPEYVYPILKKYKNIKANPDTGHSYRSKVPPMVALKKYDGYIASVHFKDLNKNSVPVVYGEGVLDAPAMLAELDRQGFDGTFVIEYEKDFDNNFEDVKKCVEYLHSH